MQRGDIYLVDLGYVAALEPAQGSEANKSRPAVVVSNDAANRAAQRSHRGVVTVVPITSNIERIYPFQVRVPAVESGLDLDSKAQAEQVRSVDAGRLRHRMGALTPETLRRLDDALRTHLAL